MEDSTLRFNRLCGSLLLTLTLSAHSAWAATPMVVQISEPSPATAIHQLPVGAGLQIQGIALDEETTVIFELEKFQVWKPGAKITVTGPQGVELVEPEVRSHFHGRVAGDEDSFAFASLDATGSWRALAVTQERFFLLSSQTKSLSQAKVLDIQEVELSRVHAGRRGDWSCATDSLTHFPGPFTSLASSPLPAVSVETSAADHEKGTQTYIGDVAIETDWEFFNLLGSTAEASAYVSDLMGAVAAIFLRDINTMPQISDLFLYTEGASQDPWSGSDVVSAVFEVRDYWVANRTDVERSIVNFLTGKNLGGGVAFVGSLCDTQLGYGVTGEISGSWDPKNPLLVSDLYVLSHELGHSFGSDHTHCYNGIPLAGDPPIDMCWGSENRCYSGPTSLPATGGSIMSYCSQQSGGLGNINLWLSREGFYGERNERVAETMRSYLDSVASCLPTDTSTVFNNGFESGDTADWSGALGGS